MFVITRNLNVAQGRLAIALGIQIVDAHPHLR
jgi:hypothetical protein